MNNKPRPNAAAGQRGPSKHRASPSILEPTRRPNTPSNVFASLKNTQIITLKPFLPAELIATILDYLPVSDLLQCAQVSKRLQEMVYDDTRWVARLRAMGVWNEAEARQRYEESKRKRMSSGRPHAGSVTLFDAHDEEEKARKSLEQAIAPIRPRHNSSVADGFDDMTISQRPSFDSKAAMTALRRVKSIRGYARQEYAKVHGALAPFYYDLVRSDNSSEPAVLRLLQDPEQQARILADLKVFARSDTAQKWLQRVEKLESVISAFENDRLSDFSQAYAAQDVDSMKQFAHVLVSLNGGAAAIDMFITNHPYMRRKDQVGNPLDCLDGVAHGHVDLNPSRQFFEKLATMLNVQSDLIDQVFPTSVNVLLPFATRVCEETMSDFITTLFVEAHEKNAETYLKAVSGVFQQAMRFSISVQPSKASETDFNDQLQKVIAHCFEPHVNRYLTEEIDHFRNKCEEEVTSWEKELSEQEAKTESFFMSNISRQAAKRDFLSSFKKVVMMPVNALPAFPSASRATQSAQAHASEQTSTSGLPDPPLTPLSPLGEAPTTELAAKTAIMNSRLEGIKSLFSIEVALSLIHHAKASIERAAIFRRMGENYITVTREQCDKVFVSLLIILGRRHIQNGFDKAVEHLSSYNPKDVKEFRGQIETSEKGKSGVEPLVTFLELVNVGDLIQQMVDVFYAQELVAPGLTDKDDFLNPAVKEKKRFEQMLDERVAAGMGKGIDVLMDEVEYMFATLQPATDFNPLAAIDPKNLDRRGSMMAAAGLTDIGPTETAQRVVETIQNHTGMLVGSTDKNMLDVFNQEVGLRLFTVLCKHIKRQRISVDGAIKLISDTNLYNSFITTLRQKTLLPYFTALRELSQIYLVDCGVGNNSNTSSTRTSRAKELATIIADNDRYRGIFRAEEVYEFAERRADWYQVRRDVERAMYGIGCGVM